MTLVLDSGAVTALAGDKERLAALARRGAWPPKVPAVVLAECLTGDHRRDHAANRLLRTCTIVPVEEPLAREAARLRATSRRARHVSAVDAVVAALAAGEPRPTVLTGDPADLLSLTEQSDAAVTVVRI
ncbi:type II toxin-antitoxin system VapC family toxin [Kineosporia sp. A_224]|uniref:type II toxin-antitoxin system VapC family toxin n=1 Tax=Kineosporia sp. A_224 TaxID=1962180 RepID=UPI000B4B8C8D|nr:PIN domain-containing protein [Kineosporia sp. A_224]